MPRTHRIFPGYPVAAVATIALVATAPGQTFIVSLLNTEAIRDSLGLSSFAFNTTYTIATVLAALPLVITGALTDRLGPRRMLAIVALAFSLGCLVLASAQGLATLFLGFFCVRFLGQGSLSLVSTHAVAMWFHRRLGSINGVKTVALFGLWAFLPQLTLQLMGVVGWRSTYIVFAAAIALLVIPLALLFVRNTPEDLGLRTDNDPPAAPHGPRNPSITPREPEPAFTLKQARHTAAYWVLVLTSVLPSFVGTAMLFDIIPIITGKGFDPEAAATVAVNAVRAWSITMAAVAIPAGLIIDRVRPSLVITVAMVVVALAAAAMALATTPLHAAGAMVAFGLGMSLSSACGAATMARYFGRLHHGKIRSSITRLGVIATGLGPLATGLSHHLTGSYAPALWIFVVLGVSAAVGAASLHRPKAPGAD
jgi:OFA family oxalate/formate antiporter-like MFS transporter